MKTNLNNFRRDVLLRLHLEETTEKTSVTASSYMYSQERFWLLHDSMKQNAELTEVQRAALLVDAFNERPREELSYG